MTAGSALAMVLSQSLARKLFPGENPIGQRVTLGEPDLHRDHLQRRRGRR